MEDLPEKIIVVRKTLRRAKRMSFESPNQNANELVFYVELPTYSSHCKSE
ncbi:MAG TPA: hypothetical protein VK536_00565 [Candidatus Limnocylindrales bacterium]|nr:hypothetical protein [Candidatus Limnocylindrales bacterium]